MSAHRFMELSQHKLVLSFPFNRIRKKPKICDLCQFLAKHNINHMKPQTSELSKENSVLTQKRKRPNISAHSEYK